MTIALKKTNTFFDLSCTETSVIQFFLWTLLSVVMLKWTTILPLFKALWKGLAVHKPGILKINLPVVSLALTFLLKMCSQMFNVIFSIVQTHPDLGSFHNCLSLSTLSSIILKITVYRTLFWPSISVSFPLKLPWSKGKQLQVGQVAAAVAEVNGVG